MTMLKIVGGSFGLDGVVRVDYKAGQVHVTGGSGAKASYARDQLAGIDVEQAAKSKTSVLSVLLGLLVITPLLTLFFNIIGLVVGLVLTVFGSKFSEKSHSATLRFADSKVVRVTGSRSEIGRLPAL